MTVTNADDFYVEDKKDGRHAGESDKKEWVFLEDNFFDLDKAHSHKLSLVSA